MAQLVPCPVCTKDVSSAAQSCPGCGQPMDVLSRLRASPEWQEGKQKFYEMRRIQKSWKGVRCACCGSTVDAKGMCSRYQCVVYSNRICTICEQEYSKKDFDGETILFCIKCSYYFWPQLYGERDW